MGGGKFRLCCLVRLFHFGANALVSNQQIHSIGKLVAWMLDRMGGSVDTPSFAVGDKDPSDSGTCTDTPGWDDGHGYVCDEYAPGGFFDKN